MARGIDGTCKWCGLATVQKPARYWHPECVEQYNLHTRPDVQYDFLVRRDGERCVDCGHRPERWKRSPKIKICRDNCFGFRPGEAGWWDVHWDRPAGRYAEMTPEERETGAYVPIDRVVALEVDHQVPLWSVAHLPPDKRRPFFGPSNLKLRCPDCHKTKTTREAAERAAIRRVA